MLVAFLSGDMRALRAADIQMFPDITDATDVTLAPQLTRGRAPVLTFKCLLTAKAPGTQPASSITPTAWGTCGPYGISRVRHQPRPHPGPLYHRESGRLNNNLMSLARRTLHSDSVLYNPGAMKPVAVTA